MCSNIVTHIILYRTHSFNAKSKLFKYFVLNEK